MTEVKPTYEELLDYKKWNFENQRASNVVWSFVLCLCILMIVNIFFAFSVMGAHEWANSTDLGEPWLSLLQVFFKAGEFLVNVYIIWHFIFVLVYNYEEEGNAALEKVRCMIKGANKAACEYDNRKDAP